MSAPSQSGWDVVSDTPDPPAGGAPGASGASGAQGASGWNVVSDEPDKPEEPPKSTADFLLNRVPHSIKDFFSNVGSAVLHPIKTDEALTGTIQGALRYAGRAAGMDLPEDESDKTAKAFGQYLYNRYGSWEKAGNSLYKDPVGTLLDASTALTGAGGAVRGLGTVAEAADAARTAEVLGSVGEGITTAGKVANPLYLPTKGAGALTGRLIKKAPPVPPEPELPPFDPKTGQFHEPAFDPATGETSLAPQPPASTSELVQRLQKQWGIKDSPSAPQAKPPAAAPPPAATPPMWQRVRGMVGQAGVGGLLGGYLAHSLTGGVYGILSGAAIKALPMFLKSDAGQAMLAKIGPGSNAAAVGAVARDMVPALNAFGRNYEASLSQHSAFDRAKGGMVNPELARVQRERLRLPGIAQMLQQRK